MPWDYLCDFEWEGRFSKRDKLPDLTKRLADVRTFQIIVYAIHEYAFNILFF